LLADVLVEPHKGVVRQRAKVGHGKITFDLIAPANPNQRDSGKWALTTLRKRLTAFSFSTGSGGKTRNASRAGKFRGASQPNRPRHRILKPIPSAIAQERTAAPRQPPACQQCRHRYIFPMGHPIPRAAKLDHGTGLVCPKAYRIDPARSPQGRGLAVPNRAAASSGGAASGHRQNAGKLASVALTGAR